MLLTILVFVAIIPFAVVGFLYREAHIDLRQALVSAAATLAAVTARRHHHRGVKSGDH